MVTPLMGIRDIVKVANEINAVVGCSDGPVCK